MKKNKLSKEAKNLEKKLKELAKASKSRPTLINSSESYQFLIPPRETSKKVQIWSQNGPPEGPQIFPEGSLETPSNKYCKIALIWTPLEGKHL